MLKQWRAFKTAVKRPVCVFTCSMATSFLSWLSCLVGKRSLSITLMATSLPVFLCFPDKDMDLCYQMRWQPVSLIDTQYMDWTLSLNNIFWLMMDRKEIVKLNSVCLIQVDYWNRAQLTTAESAHLKTSTGCRLRLSSYTVLHQSTVLIQDT